MAQSFFIRRMDTSASAKPAETTVGRLPLIGFIYVASGEVLAEIDGVPFLCQSGQILLIPQQSPSAIRFCRNAIGYSGGFSPAILSDTKSIRYLSAPLHQPNFPSRKNFQKSYPFQKCVEGILRFSCHCN